MSKKAQQQVEAMVQLSTGESVPASMIKQIPEGHTAQKEAIAQITKEPANDIDPIKAGILERAFQFLAGNDELFKAVHEAGVENLSTALVTIAGEDVDSSLRVIKYLMRQLVQDLHFRYTAAYRQQMLAAKMYGGGVSGIEVNACDLLSDTSWYPGSPDDACSIVEHTDAVVELHDTLNVLYMGLSQVKFSWLNDYQPTELAFYWHVTPDDSKYHEVHDLYSAFHVLDEKAQQRAAAKVQKQKAALGALAKLRVA